MAEGMRAGVWVRVPLRLQVTSRHPTEAAGEPMAGDISTVYLTQPLPSSAFLTLRRAWNKQKAVVEPLVNRVAWVCLKTPATPSASYWWGRTTNGVATLVCSENVEEVRA